MKNRIIVILTFVTGLFLLNSCLKDTNDYWPDEVAGKMYATVFKPTLQTLALAPIADTIDFSFMVNIATDQPPTTDVTLTLAVDPAAVTAYNARTGKSFEAYPKIKVVTPTVTIPAGTRVGMVYGKVWGADALDACANFIGAVSIKSVSDPNITIPSNMKSYLLALPISNPYAGTYLLQGYRLHPTLGYSYIENAAYSLSTVDCKTVIKSGVGSYPSYDAKIEITADPIVVAGDNCVKVKVTVIDPSTTEIVEGGQYATFDGDATKAPIPPTTDVNYYNPKTHTFVLNYFYSSAAPRKIYEILSR